MQKANAFVKEMEELWKHRSNKEKEHHHHHVHLFHLPGHHHKEQQQTGTVEKYREVSSAIDEPANYANPSGSHFKLTVGRLV